MTLLVVTVGLAVVISFMVYKVTALRKEKFMETALEYSSLSGGTEMVGSSHF